MKVRVTAVNEIQNVDPQTGNPIRNIQATALAADGEPQNDRVTQITLIIPSGDPIPTVGDNLEVTVAPAI